jgi:hypothetical protein
LAAFLLAALHRILEQPDSPRGFGPCSRWLYPNDSRKSCERLDEPLRATEGDSWLWASVNYCRRGESDVRGIHPSLEPDPRRPSHALCSRFDQRRVEGKSRPQLVLAGLAKEHRCHSQASDPRKSEVGRGGHDHLLTISWIRVSGLLLSKQTVQKLIDPCDVFIDFSL